MCTLKADVNLKVAEYREAIENSCSGAGVELNRKRLVHELVTEYDWTPKGAEAIVSLATDYGKFMLSNALALAAALEKEDGDLGF